MLTCGAWALTLYHALDMRAPESMAGMEGMTGNMTGDMAGMDNMSGNMTGNMAGMAMSGLSAAGWSLGGAVVFVAGEGGGGKRPGTFTQFTCRPQS